MRWQRLLQQGLLCATCALLAACATPIDPMAVGLGDKPTTLTAPPPVGRVAAGISTKADVLALLGATRTVRFDSGYEVWAYRYPVDGRARAEQMTEFVVLFAPSGLVARTRLRQP